LFHYKYMMVTKRKPRQVAPPPPPPPPADKKVHTAGLGVVLILLTNYQAEVKQVIQAILKTIT
jgi:hypothetical protein